MHRAASAAVTLSPSRRPASMMPRRSGRRGVPVPVTGPSIRSLASSHNHQATLPIDTAPSILAGGTRPRQVWPSVRPNEAAHNAHPPRRSRPKLRIAGGSGKHNIYRVTALPTATDAPFPSPTSARQATRHFPCSRPPSLRQVGRRVRRAAPKSRSDRAPLARARRRTDPERASRARGDAQIPLTRRSLVRRAMQRLVRRIGLRPR